MQTQKELLDALNSRNMVTVASATIVLSGLYGASLYNYLFFHVLAESFSIAVACGIFMVAWNTRRYTTDHYLLFIGIAYLFISLVDFVHTLSYKGMNIFIGYDANAPTQLWIAARYMQSLTLLVSAFIIRRQIKPFFYFLAYSILVTAIFSSIFYWRNFPDCFLADAGGLTQFKIVSEYIICSILMTSGILVFKRRGDFDPEFLKLLLASIFMTVLSELAFTTYGSVFGFSNLLGHYFKIISFYLIYRAIIVMGLTKPYDLMFRQLHQDIRERKATEKALRLSEQRLIGVLESMPDAFVSFDSGMRYLYVNANAEHLQDARREDLLGKDARLVYPDSESRKTIGEYERVIREQRAITSTSYHAGFGRWLEIRAFPTPDGVSVFYKDVSAQIMAQKALRESEAKYRHLFENMTEEVHYWHVVRDESGNIRTWRLVDVNPPALKSWKRQSVDEIKGKTTDEIFGPGATEHYLPVVKKIMTEGLPHSFEDYFPHLDKYFRFTSVPLQDHFITTGADITEIKKAEIQLQSSLAEKDVLIKEIHHRVKNNMQVISSLVDLQIDEVEDDVIREALKDVVYRVRSMAMVHEKLYQSENFARIEFADYTRSLLNYLWRSQGTAVSGLNLGNCSRGFYPTEQCG